MKGKVTRAFRELHYHGKRRTRKNNKGKRKMRGIRKREEIRGAEKKSKFTKIFSLRPPPKL